MSDRRRAILTYGGVFLVYTLLTLAMTWPLVARLSTHLVGNGDDMWVHFWNNWWIKRTLEQGGGIYYTPLLFHPTGVSLLFHNFAWVNIALWLVLEPLFGAISAYNLTYLIHIPLCGVAMFSLSRYLTKSSGAAFLSGLVYAFWPYRMLHTNHPNVIATEGLPLLMLSLLCLVRGRRSFRAAGVAGLLVAFIGYTRWQLLILAGLMVALYLLYLLVWRRHRLNWRVFAGLGLMISLAAVLVAPAAYPLVSGQRLGELPAEVQEVDVGSDKQDLAAFLVPQHQHPLSPLYDRVFSGYAASSARDRYAAFLGHFVLALILLAGAKWRGRDEVAFWLGLALICFILALGPYLHFNRARFTHVPLPYRLVEGLLPIRLLGPPRRFNLLLAVPVAVLVGYGVLTLREWLAWRRWGRVLARPVVFTGLLGLLLLLDYVSIPTATVSASPPDFYRVLAGEAGDFAVVGLPGTRKDAEYYMFYQTVHGHPMLSGHVSRLPPEALEFASSVPLLRGMYEDGAIDTSLPDLSRQLSLLSEAGFRYLIVHKALASQHQLQVWRSYFWMRPRYEDDDIIVYPAAPVVGEDVPIQHDLGASVVLLEARLSVGDVSPGVPLDVDVIWGTTAAPAMDFQLEMSLVDEGGQARESERFTVSPVWPPARWPADAIVRDGYSLPIDPWLPGGSYTVTARLVTEEGGVPGTRAAKLGTVVMHAPVRNFAIPPLEREADAVFGDELRLLGYDLEPRADEIGITLHWQALRRIGKSYKFFVHLCDTETGELVAQADVVPRGWTYPTAWWEAREIVSDEIGLSWEDVPPGRYRLWIGVYHPGSGARLPIETALPGFAAREGRLLVPDVIVR